MSARRLAIISGSGLDGVWGAFGPTPLPRETPFGDASEGLCSVTIEDQPVIVLLRHGTGHRVPPHKINHRANLTALQRHGATDVVTFCTAGAIRWGHPVGSFAVPLDFADFTRTVTTVFDDEVRHTSMAAPFDPALSRQLLQVMKRHGRAKLGATYVGIAGPRYPSRAEVRLYRSVGHIIGMTVVPEVILANELGLRYAACALITDARPTVSHDDVVAQAKRRHAALASAVPELVRAFHAGA